jgi:mannose-6-phosphate isomerase-like protein (cupin superfamily)
MDARIVAPPLAGQVLGAEAGAFVLAEWRDPGGPPGPPRLIAPRHVHHRDDEAWYVLDGRLRVQVGTQEVEVPAGAGAFVPRGTPHAYWNPDRAPVRYLLVMTPRIYQLIQALHALTDRSPAALRAVFQAYESELLEP